MFTRQLVGFPHSPWHLHSCSLGLWGTWKMAGRFLGTSEPQSRLRISHCHGHQQGFPLRLARRSAWRKTCMATRCFHMPGLLGSKELLVGRCQPRIDNIALVVKVPDKDGFNKQLLNGGEHFLTLMYVSFVGLQQPGTESTTDKSWVDTMWMISRPPVNSRFHPR